jgi:hypothetical protein
MKRACAMERRDTKTKRSCHVHQTIGRSSSEAMEFGSLLFLQQFPKYPLPFMLGNRGRIRMPCILSDAIGKIVAVSHGLGTCAVLSPTGLASGTGVTSIRMTRSYEEVIRRNHMTEWWPVALL